MLPLGRSNDNDNDNDDDRKRAAIIFFWAVRECDALGLAAAKHGDDPNPFLMARIPPKLVMMISLLPPQKG
jgi:hypothetical protein